MVLNVIIFLVFLFFSGLFSGAETALFSLKYYQIVKILEVNARKGNLIKQILSMPSKLLSTILFGNMVVNIFMSSLVTMVFIKSFGEEYEYLAIIFITFILLIFGEVSPKLIAVKDPQAFSSRIVSFMTFFSKLSTPFTTVVSWITDISMKVMHISFGKPSDKLGKSELRDFYLDHEDKTILDVYEKQMILNLYRFSDRKAIEIMRPRTELSLIEYTDDLESLVDKVKETGFSRIPVFQDSIENIVGILYAKDLIMLYDMEDKLKFKLSSILKPPYFIPEYKKIDDLFIGFMKKYIHFAVVVDEYGGISGIVTLEDILEEIIGEIKDRKEHDMDIIKETSKSFIIEGRMEIEEFNKRFGKNLCSEEAETINGLILEMLGEMPEDGEKLELDSILFEMIEVSNNKIEKVRVIFK
ncbi:MAG: hemolysin family protein [bacterium]|nr:hemolysin family protein [bacterium]